MKIYVDQNAARSGNGSREMPFRRINDAAQAARPGDEVLVAPGVYREYVNPRYAGTEDARITYRSTTPLGGGDHRRGSGERLETLSGHRMGLPD